MSVRSDSCYGVKHLSMSADCHRLWRIHLTFEIACWHFSNTYSGNDEMIRMAAIIYQGLRQSTEHWAVTTGTHNLYGPARSTKKTKSVHWKLQLFWSHLKKQKNNPDFTAAEVCLCVCLRLRWQVKWTLMKTNRWGEKLLTEHPSTALECLSKHDQT